MTPRDRIRLIGPLSGDRRFSLRIVLVVVLVLYSAALFALSTVSLPSTGGSWPAGWDKVAHGSAFFVHVLLTSFVVRRRSLLASGAVSLVTGGAIELVQLLVATRTASLSDVVADAAGIVAGIAMISLCRRLALAKCPGRRILSRDPETRKEGETCTSGESRSSGRASSS